MVKAVWEVLPLEEIDFGNRIRTEYGNVDSLVESMRKDGEQIQPIVVKREPEGSEYKYKLICGGRRYMALKQLGWMAKAEIWPVETSEYQLRSMELRENIDRKNMTWVEEVKAKERLHALEKEMNPSQTIEDTAALVGESRTLLAQDIELGKALDSSPEIFKEAKTKSDAKKILAREKEKILKKAILKKMEAMKEKSHEGLDKICDAYRIGDCFEEIKKFPDKTFDFIELDPPYNIGNFDLIDGTQDFNDNIENYPEYIETLLTDCYRVMKTEGWLLIWFSIIEYHTITECLKKAGFNIDPVPLLWIKEGASTNMRLPERRFKKAYEVCLTASKGTPPLNSSAPIGIYMDRTVNRIHPTEKPLKTLREIFKEMVHPGDLCLVPFAGSGNSLRVLFELSATPIGFDISESYKSDYIDRVKGGVYAAKTGD